MLVQRGQQLVHVGVCLPRIQRVPNTWKRRTRLELGYLEALSHNRTAKFRADQVMLERAVGHKQIRWWKWTPIQETAFESANVAERTPKEFWNVLV